MITTKNSVLTVEETFWKFYAVGKSNGSLSLLMKSGCILKTLHQKSATDSAGGDRSQVPRATLADKKFMIIVALNFSNSFSYIELLHDGGSINNDRYLLFVQNMCTALQQQENLPRWEMCLQHDNARPNIAMHVQRWIHKNTSVL